MLLGTHGSRHNDDLYVKTSDITLIRYIKVLLEKKKHRINAYFVKKISFTRAFPFERLCSFLRGFLRPNVPF